MLIKHVELMKDQTYCIRLSIEDIKKLKLNSDNRVSIEKMTGSEKEYEVFLKLLGLWELLIKEFSDKTGYSKEWCKYDLKQHAGFGIFVEKEKKYCYEYIFIPRSMAWVESTPVQRSELFTKSFLYLKENEIIDTDEFENRYTEITGKNLIY